MADFVYRGKIIGGVFWMAMPTFSYWCHEHEESGIGADCDTAHDSREEAERCLIEDHLEYLSKLKDDYQRISSEMSQWKEHFDD